MLMARPKLGLFAVKTAGSCAVVIEGPKPFSLHAIKVYIDTKFGDSNRFCSYRSRVPPCQRSTRDMDYAVYSNPTSVYETVPTYVGYD